MTSIRPFALAFFCGVLALGGCSTPSTLSTTTTPPDSTAEAWPGVEVTPDLLIPTAPLRIRAPKRDFYQAMPSGTTVLRLLVDETGRVQRTKIVESSGDAALDATAARSLLGASFMPYRDRERGVAVAVTTLMPIRFRGGMACNGIRPSNC